MGSLRQEHDLAGITVAVVRDDALQVLRGYGQADLATARPVEPATSLFRIGSVSKTFIWTAVMLLVERGELDLDTDVNAYLHEVEVNEAFGEPVTLRQLMAHRAGFEDSLQLFTVADDDPRPLAELLIAHQPRRIYPPGVRTAYSNWGAGLAAQIVEDAAGQAYREFLQQALLTPLGMQHTTWQAPRSMEAASRERLATGYRPRHGGLGLQDYLQLGAYWPVGGMASTATDMARWMRFHLNGGELDGIRLLAPDTHARMWQRAYDDRPDAADVAHGWQDMPYRGLRTLGHGGGTAAFLTNLVLVPELDLGVFVSQNSAHTMVPITQLPTLLIDRLTGIDPVPLFIDDIDPDALAELAGSYRNNRRVFSTFAAMLAAFNVTRLTPVSHESFELSHPMEGSDYYRRLDGAADVFENASGGRVAMVRDADGDVVALADAMGVHTLERLGIWEHPNTLMTLVGLASLLTLTTLLGAWRRIGRGGVGTLPGRVAGTIGITACVAQGLFIAAVVVLAMGLADFDLSRLVDHYPATGMFLLHYAGWLVGGIALLILLALWPAWIGSGWSLWRRLHFSLFALALLLVSLQLWQWRIIGADVI
ncbi:serine hydrolase domain-containing protein [Halomonas sp. MA07-2]|uniref:serine hydrolase domain-containing protein n=1 Tax=unclassified Halomonas TaxID=2609666 RepID=UPI003EEB5C47